MARKREVRGKHAKGAADASTEQMQARANEYKAESKRRVEQMNAQAVDQNQATVRMDAAGPATKRVQPSAAAAGETVAMPKASQAAGGANDAGAPATFGVASASGQTFSKKKIPRKTIGIAAGSIVGAIALVYLVGTLFFSSHFLPNSVFNEESIAFKSTSGAASLIEDSVANYVVEVTGQGLGFSLSSEDLAVDVDGKTIAEAALETESPWVWPVSFFKAYDITSVMAASYDNAGLSEIVETEVAAANEDATDPVDATIEYSSESGSFEIVPEELGTALDAEAVLAAVEEAIASLEEEVAITEDYLAQPSVLQDDERLAAAVETANEYIKADLIMMMGDNEVGEINADQISEWITLDEDVNVAFDEDEMDEWLGDYGDSLDTIDTKRTYTRGDGTKITVSGGTYGWEVDSDELVEQVREEIMNGTQGEFSIPLVVSAETYNPGGAEWGAYVDVDLGEQHAYYYDENGDLLWESDVITGTPDGEHDTPEGVWTLYNKESPSTLEGEIDEDTGEPEYETEVTYWMAFTYEGHGLHDATWQSSFGGTLYKQGYGSHGCVNLPLSKAKSLYNLVSVGIPVIVHS